jgi:hypothetical protein
MSGAIPALPHTLSRCAEGQMHLLFRRISGSMWLVLTAKTVSAGKWRTWGTNQRRKAMISATKPWNSTRGTASRPTVCTRWFDAACYSGLSTDNTATDMSCYIRRDWWWCRTMSRWRNLRTRPYIPPSWGHPTTVSSWKPRLTTGRVRKQQIWAGECTS